MVNIRDISIRCGSCLNYQTLTAYAKRDGWNIYTYECDADSCDTGKSRTLVEVPEPLDEFAQSLPDCGGGCSIR